MDGWMTTREAAKYLKLSTKTVRKLATNGSIKAYKVCGKWRFRKEELDRYVLKADDYVIKLVNKALGGGRWK